LKIAQKAILPKMGLQMYETNIIEQAAFKKISHKKACILPLAEPPKRQFKQ
jgi:hypothetical protein